MHPTLDVHQREEKRQLAHRRRTFRSRQLASLSPRDSGAIQRRAGTGEVKEQKGRTWQPRTTTSYIKRMLSQQSNRAVPVNCDTIQLLVTLCKARRKTYCTPSEQTVY